MTCQKLQYFSLTILFGGMLLACCGEITTRTCPSDYDYYEKGNRCYKWYTDEATWKNARNKSCQRDNADLIVIQDEDTSEFVTERVIKHELTDVSIWLGLREVSQHKFKWIDKTRLVYNQWHVGEPNNSDPDTNECSSYRIARNTRVISWYDIRCEALLSYGCEKMADIYPACFSGFVAYMSADGKRKCVKVVRDRKSTWNAARLDCQSQGGDLVIIRDESYLDFIKEISNGIVNHFWIGLRTIQIRSNFYEFLWVDGSSLGYTNWDVVEPYQGANPSECVVSFTINQWPLPRWNDVSCRKKNSYICEHESREALVCPGIGWTLHRQTNKCYKLQKSPRTFEGSREKCLSQGGDLVIISDTQTRDYVISEIGATIKRKPRYFIGFKKWGASYKWLDGSPLNPSVPSRLDSHGSEICGTLQHTITGHLYTDIACTEILPSICHKTVSRDYPILECPRGYTTYVTTTLANRWRVTCLMSQNNHRKSYSDAKKECRDDGGDLFPLGVLEEDIDGFIRENLLVSDNSYWYNDTMCSTQSSTGNYEHASCRYLHNHYVCQHWGNITGFVDLRKLRRIDQAVYAIQDGSLPKACVADVCQASNLTDLYRRHGWTKSTTHASIVTDTDLSVLIKEYRDNRLLYHTEEHECRIEARLTPLQDDTFPPRLRVTFPVEKLLCLCLDPNIVGLHDTNVCPGKLPQGSIDILNKATTPKNGSTAPNKLCPCRCSSGNIDFNPSPRVLAGIISKIQKELKVDREQLSLKRSKKISSPDSRTESQAIGYVGVLLCLIPFGLLIAADLVRVFQFMTSP